MRKNCDGVCEGGRRSREGRGGSVTGIDDSTIKRRYKGKKRGLDEGGGVGGREGPRSLTF